MHKEDVKEFAQYEVYELVNDLYHPLCVCNEYMIARAIAILMAKADPEGDTYYVTGVNNPGALVPGGGWYDAWHRDLKTGKLIKDSLS